MGLMEVEWAGLEETMLLALALEVEKVRRPNERIILEEVEEWRTFWKEKAECV